MKLEKRLSSRKQPVQDRSIFLVEAINEAAIQVFAENGYHSTTTTMIAKRAGASVGSLYQYYPNKDAIIVRIMYLMVDISLEHVTDALKMAENEGGGSYEILRIFTEALVSVYLNSAPLLRTVLEDAPHPQSLVNHFHEAVGKMTGLLEESLSRCELPICNHEFNLSKGIANIVSAAADWYVMEALYAFSVGEIVENTTAMIVKFVSDFGGFQFAAPGDTDHAKVIKVDSLSKNAADLYDFVIDRGEVSIAECDAILPLSRRTLQRNMKGLVEMGLIRIINAGPTDPRKRYKAII